MRILTKAVGMGVLILMCGAAEAQDFGKLSEAERQQVNTWLAERAEQMIEAHKLEREVMQAWSNQLYTNAEIEALRKRYQELQQALAETQHALEKKVSELPEIRAKQSKVEALKTQVRALAKMVEEKVSAAQ